MFKALKDEGNFFSAPSYITSCTEVESHGQLDTQSTRHKEAVNSSQANIKAVLPTMHWSPNFLAVVFKKQKNHSK